MNMSDVNTIKINGKDVSEIIDNNGTVLWRKQKYIVLYSDNNDINISISWKRTGLVERDIKFLYTFDLSKGWKDLPENTTISTAIPMTNKIYIKRTQKERLSESTDNYVNFEITESPSESNKIKIAGYISGLTGGVDADDMRQSWPYNFFQIFSGTEIYDASELKLYYTSESFLFESAFASCKKLKYPPKIEIRGPMVDEIFSYMFYNCSSLEYAPELPSTTLFYACYLGMFRGCTSLKSAPELPATNLSYRCYSDMFYGCTSLTEAPELPATTLADNCYSYMFSGCTSLKQAPELPATTLADRCYSDMFYGCTSLKVKEYDSISGTKIFTCPSQTGITDSTKNMFLNTAGTFTGTPIAGYTYCWYE